VRDSYEGKTLEGEPYERWWDETSPRNLDLLGNRWEARKA